MSSAAPAGHSSAAGREKEQAAPRPTGVPPTHPPVCVLSAGTRAGSHTPLPSACGHLHNFNKLVTGSPEVGVSGSRGGGEEGNSMTFTQTQEGMANRAGLVRWFGG